MKERMSDEIKYKLLPFKAALCRKMLIEVVGSARGFLVSDTGLFGCTCEPRQRGKSCLMAAAVRTVCPHRRSIKMKRACDRSDRAYGEY